jgi:capsular exopolysaccharide synthesis family protein
MSLTTPFYRRQSNAENAPLVAYEPRPAGPPALVSIPEEPAQLSDYFQLIQAHWKVLAWSALTGCLLGLLLTLLQTPSYRAKTSIEIQNINGDFLNMKQAHPVADDQQGNDALIDMQTQLELLESASLAEATKQAMRQAGLKREWMPYLSPLARLFHLKRSVLDDKVLDQVADSVKVRVAGQTRIIQIQVDAPNPGLASDFANILVTEYRAQNIRARTQMTEAAEEWTQSQIVGMRRKLESSEQALQQYAAKYGLVFTSDRSTISDDGLRQVQSDLLHARTDLAEKQARRQIATSSAKADSLADGEKDADLRELRSKLVDLRRQEAELLTIYKPTYSDVVKVKAQADQLERALEQAQQRVVGRVMDEYKESTQREQLLASAYQNALSKAASDSQVAVQYDILKREADANLVAYQDMLAKIKELSLAAAFRTSNVRVVDPAEPPRHQRTPQMPLNLALGLFSGLGLALGYVLITERSNNSLRHPGEATMRLGITELAAIPTLSAGFADFIPIAAPKNPGDFDGSLTVIENSHLDDDVPTTDAFRTLLTSIMFSGGNGSQPKVVVITSVAAQEGKTTVASNLAIALARAGKRVLLIDGDLRHPSLHTRFSVPNMIGLGNLLQAGCDATDAQFAVLQTAVTRLSVLPSGSFTASPADLLFQPNLLSLMDSYREHFDMIIIDSAPLVGLPDARLLGRASDGVVLVARANKTPRTAIVTACHRLGLDHSRVLGIVLNDWNGYHSPYPS